MRPVPEECYIRLRDVDVGLDCVFKNKNSWLGEMLRLFREALSSVYLVLMHCNCTGIRMLDFMHQEARFQR